ncbi:MAG: hypothetical protein QOG64_877, partial [Acidimicrobiaceae bacterium]|nr:hypothetical protein [Acidimicrobiaceae bacterium]
GGAAFDPAGRRATALGADAAPTIDDAAAFLEDPQLLDHPSRRFADRARQEAFDLETAFGPLVSATMAEISLRYPAAAWFDRTQSVRTRADLSWILRYCGAAIDVDDPTLFDDFLSWKRGVLAARGVPAEALTVCLDSLQHVLRPRFPRATRLIQQSRRISHVKRRKSVATAVA